MDYARLPDLYARFGEREINQIADIDRTGTADAVLVDRALSDAAAEIDAALLGRYALPVATVPDLLRRIACDLARYFLYADQPGKEVEARAKNAREMLLWIASGKLKLDLPSPGKEAPNADARIDFGRSRMEWPT